MNAEDKLDAIFDALPRNVWSLVSFAQGADYDILVYEDWNEIEEAHCFTADWYAKPLHRRKLDLFQANCVLMGHIT